MNCYFTCQKLSKSSKTCFTTTKETEFARFNLAHPVVFPRLVGNCDYCSPCIWRRRGGGFPSEYCHTVWYRKAKIVWLPDGEKSLMICAAVSTRRYCDGQTDRQMDTLWRHVRAMHRKQEAQLSQRGRACFVFICSQLQHTYSAGFLLLVTAASDLSVYKILLNSVLLSPIVSGGVRPTPPWQTPLCHNPLVLCRSWSVGVRTPYREMDRVRSTG